jgi:hypothetical protein
MGIEHQSVFTCDVCWEVAIIPYDPDYAEKIKTMGWTFRMRDVEAMHDHANKAGVSFFEMAKNWPTEVVCRKCAEEIDD